MLVNPHSAIHIPHWKVAMSVIQKLTEKGIARPPKFLPDNVHYETMMGPSRGRLAVTLDLLTDAMAFVGQHGVYCQSQRWPGKPVMDIQIIMKNIADAKIPVGPGYQVQFAETIRREAAIPTAAVGVVVGPNQAESILASGQADMVFLAREMLRDPYWPRRAAQVLGVKIKGPVQYERAW